MGKIMQVESRDDFPELLKALGLYGTYVEVGVEEGAYSRVFLPNLAAKVFQRLVLVDPWDLGLYFKKITQKEMEEVYHRVKNLAEFNPGVDVLRMRSVDASRTFQDAWVDFVYIDALHDYGSVREDIAAWRPKIRPGGVLAGHDLYMPGVKQALAEFCAREGKEYQRVTREADHSWYLQV
jgi:hypothetical protein